MNARSENWGSANLGIERLLVRNIRAVANNSSDKLLKRRMSRRKKIKSKQQFDAALVFEQSGDQTGAIKLYQKAVSTDPLNWHAWNRQMVLYRKTRSREEEVKLIKTAITAYEQSIRAKQEEWLSANRTKAESTRELATVLGLLEPSGLPKSGDTILEKWKTRLYLLEYRIKNARKKKHVKNVKSKTAITNKTAKAKSKTKTTVAKTRTKHIK